MVYGSYGLLLYDNGHRWRWYSVKKCKVAECFVKGIAMMEAMENCLVAISVSLFCSNIVDVVEEAL